MNNHSFLVEILILLVVSIIVISVFRRFHMPSIIGFLGAGMITGPYGMGWVLSVEDLHLLSEFGVVFLLFTIGLEFSLSRLWAMRHSVLFIGGGQVFVTVGLITALAMSLGYSWEVAFVVAGALAMSSTAIVIKQLTEQVELKSRHGQMSIGILLFQDLAVVPFLVMIPLLGVGEAETGMIYELFWAMLKGISVFVLMISIGRWVIRPMFDDAVKSRSTELFTFSVLLVTLGAAYLTEWFGLSLALGAFLAGMMLSETKYKHQIELDIRPFQDVLLGLFFITVGMITDFHVILQQWYWLIPAVFGLLLMKAILIFGVAKSLGIEQGVALRSGISLAQGGEFGFVLLALAVNSQVLNTEVHQFVLATIFLSMLIAPFMIQANGYFAVLLCGMSYKKNLSNITQKVTNDLADMSDHVIICGYGLVGERVSHVLEREKVNWAALDLDIDIINGGHCIDAHIDYGDATHNEILLAAGLQRAKAIVVTFTDFPSIMKLLDSARKINSTVPIVVRANSEAYIDYLRQAGATEVIPEFVDSSLLMVSQLLLQMDLSVDHVFEEMEAEWRQRYYDMKQKNQ